jgi:hypothetical protein
MQRENSNIDLPLGPSGPKKGRKGVIIAGAVAVLLLGLFIGQATGSKGDTAKAAAPAPVVTTTPAVPYPYPTVDPTLGSDDVSTSTPTQAPVVQTNPNAKACETLKRASTLPPYSIRWDDVMFDAEDQAKTDTFYKAIYHAENEVYGPGYNYENEAAADIRVALKKFC